MHTGEYIYFINNDLKINRFHKVFDPLVGLYITSENNLLILNEISLNIINSNGEILISENFDLIEDYEISGEVL